MASAGSATEHIALIVDCLRRAAGANVPVGLVRSSTGVDLAREPGLLAALSSKPDIEVAADGSSLRFIPPYPDLRDAEDIVALLKRENGEAVLEQDVLVSNASLAVPLQRLVDEGQVIRLRNIDAQHSAVLFARLAPIICPLPARVQAKPGDSSLRTDGDLSQDLVRGDVIMFEGRAPLPGGSDPVADTVPVQVRARVSRLTGQGQGPAQCLRARLTGAQDSAAPWLPHLVRDSNPYLDDVDAERLPLEGQLPGFARGAQASRLGVSADIRELWRAVRTPVRGKEPLVPEGYPKDHEELRRRMSASGIAPGPVLAGTVGRKAIAVEAQKRARARSQTNAAKRMRSVVVGSRGAQTNSHVAGSAVGAALERARLRAAQKHADAKSAAELERLTRGHQ